MNSRERVLTALNHHEPDMIPWDLGGTESSGLTAQSLCCLSRHLGINAKPKVFEPYQYVAYVPYYIKRIYGIDTINLTPEPKKWVTKYNPVGFKVLLPEKWEEKVDEHGNTTIRNKAGVVVAKRPNGGFYFDPVNPPLAGVNSADDLDKFKETIFSFDWPFFVDESLDEMVVRAKSLYEKKRCVVFNLCCHVLAGGQLLRGFENFMMDILINEVLARRLLDLLLEGFCERIKVLGPKLRQYVDVVLLNDDLGTQNGPMLSVDLYRKLIKPYHRDLFAKVKKCFGAPLLFHSCGSVHKFIPDLIEIGVNALNPIQVSATGMDLKFLKKEFGSSLTFWGGGIDTQNILNREPVEKVKDAVKKSIDILAPGGGFVFCQVHNIQPDVPPENIMAMFDTFEQHRKYNG